MRRILKHWVLRPLAAYLFARFLHRVYLLLSSIRSNPTIKRLRSGVGDRIAQQCPSLFLPYQPSSILYYSGILSTALYPWFKTRCTDPPNYHRQTFQLPVFHNTDNFSCCPKIVPTGEVSLDWAGAPETHADSIYIVVPGLTGSSDAYYMQAFVQHMKEHHGGARIGAYNPRGQGGNRMASNFLYSGGYTHDLRYVIQHVYQNIAANRPIFVVGFSLGGNVVTKMIGEDGEHCVVTGAICCSPPIDFLSMSNHLSTSFTGKVLDSFLVKQCNRKALSGAGAEYFRHIIQKNRPTTMRQFDGQIIASMMGCQSASHYYREASSGPWLHKIRVPMLFVLPEDDPIVDGCRIRRDDFATNPCLIGVFTKFGGHTMDLPCHNKQHSSFEGSSWFDKIVVEFTRAVLKTK
jgi:predicted alpha/beta-fold hydrolase